MPQDHSTEAVAPSEKKGGEDMHTVSEEEESEEVLRDLSLTPTAPGPSDIKAPSDPEQPFVASTETEVKAPDLKSDGYVEVKVFYGTDRKSIVARLNSAREIASIFASAIWMAVAAVLLLVGSGVFRTRRVLFRALSIMAVLLTIAQAYGTFYQLSRQRVAAERNSIYYGAERGDLEFGVAKVSIPRTHKMGELESPSIFRAEFKEDPTKHVVMLKATYCTESDFLAELKEKLVESSRHELFIFVHGYHVTFEDAVRRTAQIAYDMEFTGAAITYSWPSQGNFLGYTTDEDSVQYTVSHLKEFISTITNNNPGTSINLVAHSMGNRALTMVLKEFALEQSQNSPPAQMFGEVVLAAPDVDADVFKQRVLSQPSILNVAHRVTLYASSNDKALLMSKKVHGFHRAGETGEGLVVLQGIDTIDVSQIDLSILGHSYYGDSQPIIRDLKSAMLLQMEAAQRLWLQPMEVGENLKYWIYARRDAPPAED